MKRIVCQILMSAGLLLATIGLRAQTVNVHVSTTGGGSSSATVTTNGSTVNIMDRKSFFILYSFYVLVGKNTQ